MTRIRLSVLVIPFLLYAFCTTAAAAVDRDVANGLRRGCLFAYYPDDKVIWFKIDFGEDVIRAEQAKQVSVAPLFSSAPPEGDAGVDVERALVLGKRCTRVDVKVVKKGSTASVFDLTIPVANGTSEDVRRDNLDLRGEYEVQFTLMGLPEPVTVSRPLVRESFEWEGNTLGITNEIYPPFEPVTVKGRDVSVVLRRYTMNGFGLWDKVVTLDRDILDGPVTLRYTTAAGEGKWGKRTVELDKAASTPQKAVFRATAASAPVTVKTVSTIEMDGCMRVDMTLMPGDRPAEITRLWIDIPIKDKEAPLFHEVSDYMRKNFSGYTPAGTGRVWDSTKSRRTAEWCNPFTSYIWIGAEERGLCWFAENDRGWITQKGEGSEPLQELVREGGRLTLRVYLVNKPTTIREAHDLVFGLQASPVKPMSADWRSKTTHMPGGSGPVNPWGGLHCGYKGPFRNDWQIVDKIVEAQKTGKFDEAWFKDYVATYNPPPCYGNWKWYDSVRSFSGMRQRPVMTYQEEMIQSVLQPQWVTFQDQWRNAGTLGTEMRLYTQREWPTEDIFFAEDAAKNWSNPSMYVNYIKSYREFGCWFANEWFKRGVSAYWDNTFPKYTYNTRNSAAYVTESGAIQPAMTIWEEREYMKRVWNLLQYWRLHQGDQLEWSHHMTNALVLPLNGWATVNLDYELGGKEPFTPQWHRTEAIGRQAGAMVYWLYTPTGSNNPVIKELEKTVKDVNDRPDWGMKMVHEALRCEYTGGSSLRENGRVGAPELEQIVVDFGYTDPERTRVFNYWDERPATRVDNDTVKWIVITRPADKTALIVLQSWDGNATAATVTLDNKVIGFAPKAASDAESKEAVAFGKGGFTVELGAPYGTRLIEVK